MDINLVRLVRVSAIVLVALILPFYAAVADDSPATQPTYEQLIQNIDTCNANQDYSGAFSNELQAITVNSSRGDAIADCIGTLTQNTPNSVSLTALSNLPPSTVPFDILTTKTEAGAPSSDDATVILVPHDVQPTEIDDPVESWPFGRAMYVYSTNGADKASLVCTIHYQTTDNTDLAERTGALLSLLDKVYSDRMLVSRADDGYPFHVWLCATAPVSNGGEQWRNNIYFYDVSDSRSSIEWIREIAHEFSHLAFPAVGGSYTDPEAFANGYLGERLLVRWLSKGTDGGTKSVEAAWKGTFSGYFNFNRLLIAPPLKEFHTFGLNKKRLAERDAEGMRYLVGMILAIDDRFGSAAVGTLLQGLADQHSSDPNLLYNPVHDLIAQYTKSQQHKAKNI